MTSWYLTIWELTIQLFQEQKEISKWKKERFSLLHQCSLLDIQNRLSKNVVDATFTGWYPSKYQNGCFKKTKHARFSEKQTFLTPWYAHIRCSFFGKFGVLCFVETLVLRFALLPYYRRIWAKNPTSNILEIIRKPMVF